MCVCCGEWYFVVGRVVEVREKMCASCEQELSEMDARDFDLFMRDAERVIAVDESRAERGLQSPTVEELICLMQQ